jgi:hypothetical protein
VCRSGVAPFAGLDRGGPFAHCCGGSGLEGRGWCRSQVGSLRCPVGACFACRGSGAHSWPAGSSWSSALGSAQPSSNYAFKRTAGTVHRVSCRSFGPRPLNAPLGGNGATLVILRSVGLLLIIVGVFWAGFMQFGALIGGGVRPVVLAQYEKLSNDSSVVYTRSEVEAHIRETAIAARSLDRFPSAATLLVLSGFLLRGRARRGSSPSIPSSNGMS